MSKRGKRLNRERRGAAAGASWTAARAAETVVTLRDEVVERYPGHPLLSLMAARHHQTAMADLMVYRGHGELEADDKKLWRAYKAGFLDIVGERIENLPEIPEEVKADSDAFAAAFAAAEGKEPISEMDRRVGHMLNDRSATALRVAELYVISPPMHAAVMAAAETLTREDLGNVAETDVAAAAGAVFLPYPQLVAPTEGQPRGLRMLSWQLRARERSDGVLVPSVRIEGWAENPQIIGRQVAKNEGHPLPRLVRVAAAWLALSTDGPQEGPYMPRLGAPMDKAAEEADVVGEFAGEKVVDSAGDLELRYLFAFWRLAAQEVATLSRPPAMHDNGLRTGEKAHEVRVVQLRAANAEKPEGVEGPTREYRHRHVVRMHKVNQWYPSEGRHKVIWRGPYIRGPEGAPLLVGEKVQALVR